MSQYQHYQDCEITIMINGKKVITGKADYFTIQNESHSFGPQAYSRSYTFGVTMTDTPNKKKTKKKKK